MKVVSDDAIEAMRRAARAAAIAAAESLTTIVAVADAAHRGYDADEVAFALTWTQGQARCQIEFGRYLIDVLPMVFAAFRSGDIDSRRAWTFYDVLATVDDCIAAAIADKFVSGAGEWTTTQLRDRLRRAVLKADPDGAKDRTRRSLTDRHVGTTPDRDGTASLFGVQLPAARVGAAFERVDAYARGIKQAGDERTLEQLRADTFLDLLEGIGIGAHPIHRAGTIELTVPWETAIGVADEPATLAGYGPISADIARQILTSQAATAAQWTFSAVGVRGELLAHGLLSARPMPPDTRSASAGTPSERDATDRSEVPTVRSRRAPTAQPMPPAEADPTRRAPGAALTRWIRARDRTCRAPGCTRRARYADIDHTIPHSEGGLTTHNNLAVFCRHHHRLKHEAGWIVTQTEPGHIEWTSPDGHTYQTDTDPP
jgi:hypothetical protein